MLHPRTARSAAVPKQTPATTGRSRGQALVEFALIAPIICLLLLGAVDLGRVWQSQITIENAAREGAMEGIFKPDSYDAGQPCDTDTNRIMCRIANEVDGSAVTVTPADVTVTCDPDCTQGTTGVPHKVVVTVQGHFSLLTPLMAVFTGGQNITLQATAESVIAMTPTGGPVGTPVPTATPTATPFATPAPTPTGGATPTPTPTATPTPAPQPCVAPVASFTVNPANLLGRRNSTTFQFTSTATNMANPACNPVWSWSFGDGPGSTLPNPTKQYGTNGAYVVTLVASNSAGSSQRSVTVTICNNLNNCP